MSEITRQYMEGLIVQDYRVSESTLWGAESTFTEAGISPGIPAPDQSTAMALQASGGMFSTDDITIRAQRAGMPGVNSAGFVWKEGAASGTNYHGKDQPNIITGFSKVTAFNGQYSHPHSVTLSDGTVVLAALRDSAPDRISVLTRDPDTGTWGGEVTTHLYTENITLPLGPCLVALPDDTVYLYVYEQVTTGVTLLNMSLYTSTDKGATWTLSAQNVLPASLSSGDYVFAQTRNRIAYKAGQFVAMLAVRVPTSDTSEVGQSRLIQYGSVDGVTWSIVEIWDGSETDRTNGAYQSLTVWSGFFCLLYPSVTVNTGVRTVHFRRFADAFSPSSSAEVYDLKEAAGGSLPWGTIVEPSTGFWYFDGGGSALVAHEGRLIAYGRSAISPYFGQVYYSDDIGATWAAFGPDSSTDGSVWWCAGEDATGLSTFNPTEFQAVSQGGRVLMCSNFETPTGSVDGSIGSISLGGWSKATMPVLIGTEEPFLERGTVWSTTWLSVDLPSQMLGAVAAGTATTETITSSAQLQLTTDAVNTLRSYAFNPSTLDLDLGGLAMFECQYVAGTTIDASPRIGALFILGDGANKVDFHVSVKSGAVTIYDRVALANVVSTAWTTTSRFQVLLAYNGDSTPGNGKISAWIRTVTGDDEVRAWTSMAQNQALTYAASADASVIKFGHVTAASDTTTSYWHNFHYTTNPTYLEAPHLSEGFTNPADLRPGAVTPEGVCVVAGLKVSASTGPALAGQTWNIPREYDYQWEHILPDSFGSPSVTWRTEDDTVDAMVAWKLDTNTTDSIVPDSYGIVVKNINWRKARLQTYSGAWLTDILLDAATGLTSLPFVREGHTVRADASATGSRYLEKNELAGGTVDFGSGKLRRIVGNDPGAWGDPASSARVRLYLEGVNDTEATSGNIDIWAPQIMGLSHETTATANAKEGYRLKIDSTYPTVEGYFETGSALIGALWPFGFRASWGTSRRLTPNTLMTQFENGARSVVKRGPERTTVALGWTAPIPQFELMDDPATPDNLTAYETGGYPWMPRMDVPRWIQGLIEALDGPVKPVAYVPFFTWKTSAGATVQQYNRRDAGVICRITTPLDVTTELGLENKSQAVTVATLSLEEEV